MALPPHVREHVHQMFPPGVRPRYGGSAILDALTKPMIDLDITEPAHDYGVRANAHLAAKLVYRTIGLAIGE